MKTSLKPGDRVAYTAKFIKQYGYSYEIAQLRGTVTQVLPLGKKTVVRVLWDGEAEECGGLSNVFCRIANNGVILDHS
jgi:hypothetical protein